MKNGMKNYTATKYFLNGILEGITIKENVTFLTWKMAKYWAGVATMNLNTNYVVLEMVNNETGEVETNF